MRVTRLTYASGAVEPASIEELRAFGRIVSTDEDAVLESLLLAARQEVERHSGHVLVPGTFRVSLDTWAPKLDLGVTPLQSVQSVTYQYVDGDSAVVDASTYYADVTHRPGRVVFASWYVQPWRLRGSAGIEVEVTAGYPSRADIPEDIRQHVITLALLMYEHRDDPELLERVRRYAAMGVSSFAVELV